MRPIDDIILVQDCCTTTPCSRAAAKSKSLPTYNSINRQLWHKINGNTKIRMTIVDDGTNKAMLAAAQLTTTARSLTNGKHRQVTIWD